MMCITRRRVNPDKHQPFSTATLCNQSSPICPLTRSYFWHIKTIEPNLACLCCKTWKQSKGLQNPLNLILNFSLLFFKLCLLSFKSISQRKGSDCKRKIIFALVALRCFHSPPLPLLSSLYCSSPSLSLSLSFLLQ